MNKVVISMINWDTYYNDITIHGTTVRERAINHFRDTMKQNALTTPSYKKVKINGEERYLIINKSTKPYYKKIATIPDENFKVGDYVEYGNDMWIITETNSDDEIYVYGYMKQCRFILKWQDEAGNIIERYMWCENATKYSTGEIEQIWIDKSELQYNCEICLDDDTIKLRRDQRFIVNMNGRSVPLRMTQLDYLSANYGNAGALIQCTLVEDEINKHKDNLELGIADYFEPLDPPTPVTKSCKIEYIGNAEIKSGGSKKKFNAVFYNEDGEVIDLTPVWSVTFLPDTEEYFHYQVVDNVFIINVDYNEGLVDTKFKLTLQDEDESCKNELYVEVGEI
jgi:hypothetical protein